MVVGQHARDNDLEVNVMKGKKLTNIRTHSKDEQCGLTPDPDDAREGARLYRRGRRTGRGDAENQSACERACSTRNDRKRAERAKAP